MPVRPTSRTSEGVLIEGMASHDTDPHRAEPRLASDDETRTDPADATTDEGSSAFAQSLLADLARAPLPADNVRETEGHAAAAYAVAPHRPPRANEKTIETAAVVIETTEPVPRPLPAAQETTVPGARLVATTPSARAKSSRRVVFASIGGAAVAAAIAIGVVVLGGPSHPAAAPAPATTASSPASVTAPADPPPASPATNSTASTGDPAPAASPSAAASVSTSSMIATPAAPRPTAKPAPSARPSAPAPARPAKPSGNFAEPDRSF